MCIISTRQIYARDSPHEITHRSSVGRAGDCNVFVIPRSLVRIRPVRFFCMHRTYTYMIYMVGWPSGLRRQVKALISSEARVRIPSQPHTYIFLPLRIYVIHMLCMTRSEYHSVCIKTSAHLAQKVERWPFKPMVVGSIPTVGVKKFFFA